MRAALADEGVVILQKKERMSEQDGCAAGRELSLIFQETLSLSVYKPQCVEKISDPSNEISNEEYVHSRSESRIWKRTPLVDESSTRSIRVRWTDRSEQDIHDD